MPGTRTARTALLCLFTLTTPALAAGTTYYVNGETGDDNWDGLCEVWDGGTCGPKRTIQAGLDAATDGDTVIVADGTYTGEGNKNLDYAGKALALRSANGPEMCVIDCEGDGRGVTFRTAEIETSVLDGFTITKGVGGTFGGGVACYTGTGPTITRCIIVSNSSSWQGGGIFCGRESRPVIADTEITGNISRYGGGVACFEEAAATIIGCLVSANSVENRGGGISCLSGSRPIIRNCTIRANVTEEWGGEGGGIYCRENSDAIISDCTITGNAACYGAGICSEESSLTISNCRITKNEGWWGASGLCFYAGGAPLVTSCQITDNLAWEYGAVHCGGSNPIFTNCTIAGNMSYDDEGGGVYCSDSDPVITNTILWDNYPKQIFISSGEPIVTYSVIQYGWPGTGNIDTDPLLAYASDGHIIRGSPCIDSGTNAPPGGLTPDDLDGNARPLDGDGDGVTVADIGAYEFQPQLPSIACAPTEYELVAYEGGPSPDDQLLSIRNCGGGTLNWQISEDCAWLEAEPIEGTSEGEIDDVYLHVDTSQLTPGLYFCTLEVADPVAVNSPRAVSVSVRVWSGYPTIQMLIDAAQEGDVVVVDDGLYTGPENKNLDFGGKNITLRSESGPENCIIDCEGDGRGFYFHNRETADSVVDGFTITHGDGAGGSGGAIRCEYEAGPTIKNCAIVDNVGFYGGGIYCREASDPTIIDCEISRNVSEERGGGIYCASGGSLTISGCDISGNMTVTPYTDAGGINCRFTGSAAIQGCTIEGNYGGGMGCVSVASLAVADCTIAYNDRGGIVFADSEATVTNCALTQNSAQEGSALYCYNSSVTVANCAFSGWAPPSWITDTIRLKYTDALMDNCTLTGEWLDEDSSGIWLYDSTLTVSNSIVWSTVPGDGPRIKLQRGDGAHSTLTVFYSDIEGGADGIDVDPDTTLIWGAGNIDADPLFVDLPNGDDHLAAGSPCIDTGDPTRCPVGLVDIDAEPRVMGPRLDMGADEFTAEPFVLVGDLNCDCTVDGFDIDAFVLALEWGSQYELDYSYCDRMLADMNDDGYIDGFDIDPFVALLLGG